MTSEPNDRHPTTPARSRGGLVTIGCWAVFCAAAWLHQAYYDFDHDDAYISYRYAVHWAQGHGPVYNIGERVEGYTNFLHVVVLAAAHRAGLDIVRTSRALGTLASFALVAVVYLLVSRLLHRGRATALVAAAAVAVHASVAVWARSGLETVPFALLVLLAQTLFLDERRRDAAHWRSGVVFGIAALVRADGFLFAAATGLFLVVRRSSWRRVASLAVAFLIVFVPYVAWRMAYYGDPLPNSYYLKTGGGIFQQVRGLFYAYNFVLPFGGVLLFGLPLLLLLFRDRRRDDVRAYLGLCVVFITVYIVCVGGDHMAMSRFFVPIVPAIQVLLVEAALEVSAHWRDLEARPRRVMHWALLACIVSAGVLPTLNRRRLPANFAITTTVLTRQWTMAGRWLADHVPPQRLMATEPAGAVAFYSGLKVVDMLGVNDRHIAHLRLPHMGHGSAGHEKKDLAYVLSRRPDFIFAGVHESAEAQGRVRSFDDGSAFRMRCEPLGPGPVAEAFGTVRSADLYIWLEERIAGATTHPQ